MPATKIFPFAPLKTFTIVEERLANKKKFSFKNS